MLPAPSGRPLEVPSTSLERQAAPELPRHGHLLVMISGGLPAGHTGSPARCVPRPLGGMAPQGMTVSTRGHLGDDGGGAFGRWEVFSGWAARALDPSLDLSDFRCGSSFTAWPSDGCPGQSSDKGALGSNGRSTQSTGGRHSYFEGILISLRGVFEQLCARTPVSASATRVLFPLPTRGAAGTTYASVPINQLSLLRFGVLPCVAIGRTPKTGAPHQTNI